MFDRIASAVQSDCVRRPIGLRSPSDRIASAVQSDCVRRPIGLPFSVYHAAASLMRGKHEHLGYLHVFRS